jgi:hypothetical protein
MNAHRSLSSDVAINQPKKNNNNQHLIGKILEEKKGERPVGR